MNTQQGQISAAIMNPNTKVDELVMVQAWLQLIIGKIKSNGHEVPKNLLEELRSCTRVIDGRLYSDRVKELEALKVRREQLMSVDEKKRKLDKEIARLEKLVEAEEMEEQELM